MVRRSALLAALFTFAGLTSVQSPAAPVAIAQSANVAQASLPPLFSAEDAAQAHCPRDVVVWLNIPSGIYHYKGERWYGRTKHGAYACEREAIKAGDRASENGQ
jgi:hypothetical protein